MLYELINISTTTVPLKICGNIQSYLLAKITEKILIECSIINSINNSIVLDLRYNVKDIL